METDTGMDIDRPSSVKSSPSITPPSEKFKQARFFLPPAQLTAFNDEMQRVSDEQAWQYRLQKAGYEFPLLKDVLLYLTPCLANTDMKDRIIASPAVAGAVAIVKSFNGHELEQWKAGVRSGVENNDWTDLAMHRTYISDYRMLNCTTAKLQKESP
jgi:hypothetical protein